MKNSIHDVHAGGSMYLFLYDPKPHFKLVYKLEIFVHKTK